MTCPTCGAETLIVINGRCQSCKAVKQPSKPTKRRNAKAVQSRHKGEVKVVCPACGRSVARLRGRLSLRSHMTKVRNGVVCGGGV